tara:strand:+ start:168862 stop:169842 length:981 start_codon:yes stop_codon:yes gene_type:complete
MISSTNKIDISIIIVNYKSWKHLRNCLNSLKNLNDLSFAYETIVVDNYSYDGNFEKFTKEFSSVQFVLNSGNNGFANGCNFGASKARGDYFLFLNPDTLINGKALEEILSFAKLNRNVGVTSCLQKKKTGGYEKSNRIFPNLLTLFGLTRAIYKLFSKKLPESNNQVLYTDWVSGSLVFISKEWFAQINGWNEDYWMYYEDMDLSKKVQKSNGKVAVLKSVEIIHNHGGASRLNIKTSAITKTEVQISKHIYIQNHFKGVERILSHLILFKVNVFFKLLLAILGVLLFFIPKMRLNVYLFTRIISYYCHCLKNRTWLSKNSMNFNK